MNSNVFRENSPELNAYWEGFAEGKLLIPYCRSCERLHWYPRGICPHCYSDQLEPREASGRGVVFSCTHAPGADSAVAYVTLEEGPMLLARIVDTNPAGLSIGQKVQLAGAQVLAEKSAPIFKAEA